MTSAGDFFLRLAKFPHTQLFGGAGPVWEALARLEEYLRSALEASGADEADCVGGDNSHTAPDSPLFYSGDASAAVPHKWTQDFVALRPFWVGIVADR